MVNPTTPASPPAQFLDEDKSLACIHCGLCLGSCPTYLETGNENDSPRGRIYLMKAVQDGRLPLGDTAVRHIDLCLGCRACEAACPSGVEYGHLLEHTRDHIEKHHRRSPWQTFLRRFAIEQVFPFPQRMELALLPARLARQTGLERFLPGFIRDSISLLPTKISKAHLPVESNSKTSNGKRAGFISGCVMSVMFGDTNVSSVKLLNEVGYDVVTPPEQSCCGALYSHGGNLEEARKCAKANIQTFEKLNLDIIVINAAGCGSTLKEYPSLLESDPSWHSRAQAFTEKVKDLTEVLEEHADTFRQRNSNIRFPVTYHDACHLAHPQGITVPPRTLIQALAGDQFVPLPESDVCCGSAGSYNLTEPEMAKRLQKRKVENILKSGAKTVVTTNPGCMLQILAGLKTSDGSDIDVMHIADFLMPGSAAR